MSWGEGVGGEGGGGSVQRVNPKLGVTMAAGVMRSQPDPWELSFVGVGAVSLMVLWVVLWVVVWVEMWGEPRLLGVRFDSKLHRDGRLTTC